LWSSSILDFFFITLVEYRRRDVEAERWAAPNGFEYLTRSYGRHAKRFSTMSHWLARPRGRQWSSFRTIFAINALLHAAAILSRP